MNKFLSYLQAGSLVALYAVILIALPISIYLATNKTPPITNYAQTPPELTVNLYPGVVNSSVNGTFTIAVSFASGTPVSAARVGFIYDQNLLELTNIAYGAAFTELVTPANQLPLTVIARLPDASLWQFVRPGYLNVASLTFRVKAAGTTTIAFDPAQSGAVGITGLLDPTIVMRAGSSVQVNLQVPTATPTGVPPTPTPTFGPSPTFVVIPTVPMGPSPTFTPACDLCGGCIGLALPDDYAACVQCVYNTPGDPPNVPNPRPNQDPRTDVEWTVLGCVQTKPAGFAQSVIQTATYTIGGITFLIILYGGFLVLTSRGNHLQLERGSKLIRAGIISLLIVLFAVGILQLVGVKILNLPGFG